MISILLRKIYDYYRRIKPYYHTDRPNRAMLLLNSYCRGNVLDVGCGDGRNLKYILQLTKKAIGLDMNKVELRTLKGSGLDVLACDLNQGYMPIKDKSFDVIVCSHVLEHISLPAATIIEFKRISKPNGIVIISVPNVECFYYDFYNLNRHPGHIQRLHRLQWRAILNKAHLTIIKEFSNFPFFWNKTWGKFVNAIPIKKYLADIWFICKNIK